VAVQVRTNVVEVVVTRAPPERVRARATLSVSKTRLRVGEETHARIVLSVSEPTGYRIKATVMLYAGSRLLGQREDRFVAPATRSYTFTLRFDEPGTYDLQGVIYLEVEEEWKPPRGPTPLAYSP